MRESVTVQIPLHCTKTACAPRFRRMGRFECWLSQKNSITVYGFCWEHRRYTMNRRVRIHSWFFENSEKETKKTGEDIKKSPFHISWNGLFSSRFFRFLRFSQGKIRKSPNPDASIIPQQETSGNYNHGIDRRRRDAIIPQQETSGNYNNKDGRSARGLIIPQQETSGNYNHDDDELLYTRIIPQQETSGNYNKKTFQKIFASIIPQQETSGNYN